MGKRIRCFFLFFGVLLLCINISGIFISLRNNEIYDETFVGCGHGIELTEDEFYERLSQIDVLEERVMYELTELVSKGMAHYWRDEGIEKYNLRVPVYENYFLFLASYVMPEHFEKYEFYDMGKAVERGVGLCSQHAIVLQHVFEKTGVGSSIIGLSGHVVVTANVDEGEFVLDPNHGVIIPYSIQEIEDTPSLIVRYYEKGGCDDEIIENYVNIYGTENNLRDSVKNYVRRRDFVFERMTYLIKWGFPVLLVLIGFEKKK